MVVYPNLEKDDFDSPPDYNSTEINSQLNQYTVSTVISFSPEFADCTDIISSNEVGKVESLKDGRPSKISKLSCEKITSDLEKEKWYTITVQVFVPFMIAGIGTIGAGQVLGYTKNFDVFHDVKALYVLVPAILGLKGNLDMCLASRLSTQAHLGNMNSKREVFSMIVGNIGLVQVQAIVAALIVSLFAVFASALINSEFEEEHALLLACCSILTATLSCFTLDFLLIALIFFSHKIKLNPDNLATPFAASIGDVVSLTVLCCWAVLLYEVQKTQEWILILVVSFYVFVILPVWILIVRKNKYTHKILTQGWVPVIAGLFISGCGGLILDSAVNEFDGYDVFQPIINGIGGNLVSVQSSRISTMLHKTSIRGVIPPHTKQWVTPFTALISGVLPAKTARILILMSVPGQTIFVFAADFIYNGQNCADPVFVLAYLCVGLLQIMTLLYICHLLTHTMWVYKMDPDNCAIPYLTALGDLLGSSILLGAFEFLRSIQHEYSVCQPLG